MVSFTLPHSYQIIRMLKGHKDGIFEIRPENISNEVFLSVYEIDQIQKEIQETLENIISSGGDVQFDYVDQSGKKSEREITPSEIVQKGNSTLVKGECHLRHAERVFNLERIKNIRKVS